jgi:adenylate cyclase
MAFFNAPEPVDRHARCAITAVQQCMRRLTDLQDNWRQRGLPELDCRIGLHTGQALCGNFGSKSRFNFTVIGDTVNLASRLESLCKQFGVQTLFSAECVFEAGDLPGAMVRPLGKVQVVGKQQATAIFSIINLPAAPTETRMQMRDLFIQAMRLFRGHDFDQCVQVLSAYSRLHNLYSVTEDKPSRIYLDLCHRCMVNGVAPDWDCVLIMDEK